MRAVKIGTVALVIRPPTQGEAAPILVEKFSDDREIAVLEKAAAQGEPDPVSRVYAMREQQAKEEDEFGNYVEDLLSQPFVRPEIQEHGVQWLKSKIRIEQFQKCENDATRVIADYAFKLFQENPKRTEFLLSGPAASVKIRIFMLPSVNSGSFSNAA